MAAAEAHARATARPAPSCRGDSQWRSRATPEGVRGLLAARRCSGTRRSRSRSLRSSARHRHGADPSTGRLRHDAGHRSPVGVFRQPITPPTRTLQHAQRQAAQRTRRVAAKIPQPAPSIPVIAPRNQPRGYQEAVRRVAGPLVQRVHAQAIRTQQRGGSYQQSISEQLDALGPQARKLFRDYLTTVAKPNAQKLVRANLREQQRRVAMGLTPTSQLRPRSGGGGALATLGSLNPLTAVPRFLAGPLATRVQQSGGSNLAGVLRLAREPTEIARTYAEHPATIGKDFQYARDFLLGTAAIPYSVIHKGPADSFRSLVDMAKQAPRALLQDEIARHKQAFQGNYGAFRKVVQQTGASPYILDYATLASGVGKGAGLLAKSGGLGRRLEEFANRPRAELRIAPGEARRQRDPSAQVAPNLLRMGMQQRRDAARVRSYERGERRAAHALLSATCRASPATAHGGSCSQRRTPARAQASRGCRSGSWPHAGRRSSR
jgi:hypothetical protein